MGVNSCPVLCPSTSTQSFLHRIKLLLLVILVTAGATAHSISPWAIWQFKNVIKCTITGSDPLKVCNNYVLFCLLRGSNTSVEYFDSCCRTHDHGYAQVKKLESCKYLIDNTYTSSYSYSCSGNEVTCSDKDKLCESLICNSDHQAAMCFSKAPYNKQ
ncbi:phospholipase A2-like [Peromyscus leucopus]|uniref:phospholipase A2-like n=1 Tax=Peromyscus leucopus TaxID=10041 RepID=UPI001885166B|nr:phospholipase A2-like [Peromyscus leucopus]